MMKLSRQQLQEICRRVPNRSHNDCAPDSAVPALLHVTDGYQQLALKWVLEKNGGLATEADYPYIGVTNFCNTTGPMVKFKKVRSI